MEKMSETELGPSRWPDLRPVGIIALAGAMVWSTSIVMSTWKSVRIKPEHRTIKVTGSAKKRIISDLIQWDASLTAHAGDRTAAYKLLHDEVDKAVEYLKAQGIKPDEIRIGSATFNEIIDVKVEQKVVPGLTVPLRTEEKIPKGWDAHQAIFVRSSDAVSLLPSSDVCVEFAGLMLMMPMSVLISLPIAAPPADLMMLSARARASLPASASMSTLSSPRRV